MNECRKVVGSDRHRHTHTHTPHTHNTHTLTHTHTTHTHNTHAHTHTCTHTCTHTHTHTHTHTLHHTHTHTAHTHTHTHTHRSLCGEAGRVAPHAAALVPVCRRNQAPFPPPQTQETWQPFSQQQQEWERRQTRQWPCGEW